MTTVSPCGQLSCTVVLPVLQTSVVKESLTCGLHCLPKKRTANIDGAVPAGVSESITAKEIVAGSKCSPQAPHRSRQDVRVQEA